MVLIWPKSEFTYKKMYIILMVKTKTGSDSYHTIIYFGPGYNLFLIQISRNTEIFDKAKKR